MCCYCDYTLRDTWYSIRYISVYLSVLLSTVSVWKTSRGANMRPVCGCGEGTAIIIISILKGYLIHTLFIKCPITEHVLQWWIINYRSTSWVITTTHEHIKLVQSGTESNKLFKKRFTHQSSLYSAQKNGHYWFYPTLPSEMLSMTVKLSSSDHKAHYWRILDSSVSLNYHVCLSTVLNVARQMSNNCTCNAGKDFADSYQHILRHLPPYG